MLKFTLLLSVEKSSWRRIKYRNSSRSCCGKHTDILVKSHGLPISDDTVILCMFFARLAILRPDVRVDIKILMHDTHLGRLWCFLVLDLIDLVVQVDQLVTSKMSWRSGCVSDVR